LSINWRPDVSPAPGILVLPPDVASLDEAHAAIDLWEHYTRKTLDPAQRLAVEVMLAVGPDDRWAAETTGREMPRQNGKGDEIEVVETWGLVQRGEAIAHTVHDAVLLATQAQQRLLGVLEGHGDLRRRVKRTWRGTGQQMIEMRNGGVIWYRTRTSGGLRGVDNVDRVVVDEAQHATEEHVASISPTLLANPNPQLNAIGSGGIAGKSRWWWRQRRRALAANPGRFGYVGHTAERLELGADGKVVQHPVDVNDRRLWAAANPAIAAGRGGGMAFLEEQLQRLGPALFGREHLGVWDPDLVDDATGSVFGPGLWAAICSPHLAQPSTGLWFAVDVNPERTRTAIAVAGGGGTCGLVDERAGTAWAVDELVRLAREHSAPIVVGARGPAASLILPLEQARVRVVPVAGTDLPVACSWFHDAVIARTVQVRRHAVLDAAAASLTKRLMPGSDSFVWDRRSGDVCSIVALTLAAWKAQTAPAPDAPLALMVRTRR
jgi:hypothetical protein